MCLAFRKQSLHGRGDLSDLCPPERETETETETEREKMHIERERERESYVRKIEGKVCSLYQFLSAEFVSGVV
jgi:hypothetical protein